MGKLVVNRQEWAVSPNPSAILAPAIASDVTEQSRLLSALTESFPGGICLFDKDLRMVLCNAEQKRLLDYPDELFASQWPTLEQIFRFNAERGEYGPGEVEEHVSNRMAIVAQRRPHIVERTRPNGTVLEIRGTPLEGGGFVTTYLDVTEQRRAQALAVHLAHHDAMTGLANRMLFMDRLRQSMARAKRGHRMAVLYIDLDRFKPVNDRLGHAAGDAVLKRVAERLRSVVRETDTVARLGGDEFVVIQCGTASTLDVTKLARRIETAIAAPIQVEEHVVDVGASIGIAIAPDDDTDPDGLLKKADSALYRAKAAGGGSHVFYTAPRPVACAPSLPCASPSTWTT